MQGFILRILISSLVTAQTTAEFTPHFALFIREKYGDETLEKLQRLDLGLGPTGSFGGKFFDFDVINKRPIVFVHGVTLRALAFVPHRNFFLQRGYTLAELYATSFGDGGLKLALDTEIECAFIKQIRRMIVAVHEYTQKRIDVIAWSMGSIVTRKAVLGGNCTESDVYLGKPLTHMIDTFTATGGVNYGMQRCPKNKKACNPQNSMSCDCALMASIQQAFNELPSELLNSSLASFKKRLD